MSKHPRDVRLPIFRSDGQAAVLAELFVHADTARSLTEIAERTGLAVATVHAEVERLERAGLVLSRRVGQARLVEPDPTSPFHPELHRLLVKAFGPAQLLSEHLAGLAGIQEAFIFGSWASSEVGRGEHQPRDVDVMVIGSPDLDRLYEEVRQVEEVIGRPVNLSVLSLEEWEAGTSGFLRSVRDEPRVKVA